MEKSISNRFYFDYNATSPLADKVLDFLRSGDFYFGNPSSIHTTGKQAKKYLTETREYLHDLFQLSQKNFEIIFNSGATESINTFFKGNAFKHFKLNEKCIFYFSNIDHQAVVGLEEDLIALGHKVVFFNTDSEGQFKIDELIHTINHNKKDYKQSYLNFTYVNNESGIVWPLSLANEIKSRTSAIIHVDAVQLVGKIKDWEKLSNELDAYTFSGHKFGALKGVGFCFVNKKTPFNPLLAGGGQESGRRSGTENTLGVYSLKLALSDVVDNFQFETLTAAKNYIEKNIIELIKEKGQVVGLNAPYRNSTTIFFVIKGSKAELISMKFDMNQMDVSMGSACSSGIIKENRVLINMGFSEEYSRSCIRLSFSPFMKMKDAEKYSEKILSVISSFLT